MNSYIETGIAIILIIVIFSVIAYVIQELIAANLEYRGKMLKGSIQQLLDADKKIDTLTQKIFSHPQIKKLQEDLNKLPSYIPSANFALAIIDEVGKSAPTATGKLYDDFRNGIAAFVGTNGDLKTLLENYAKTSTSLVELQNNIEKWYNEYMDRVTGWYKKNTRSTLRIIAVLIAIGFNVDMISISKTINSNTDLKASLVTTADKLVDQPEVIKNLYQQNISSAIQKIDDSYSKALQNEENAKNILKIDSIKNEIQKRKDELFKNYTKNRIADIDTLLSKIDNSELPLGWNEKSWVHFKEKWYWAILGWLLGAAAISMGAPFWFDLLMKLVNVRRAGIKPDAEK